MWWEYVTFVKKKKKYYNDCHTKQLLFLEDIYMKAVIYARFSSDNQREESIIAQLRACREYCNRKKYTVVKEYIDEALTARSDNRPDFQNMISDAKIGLFDVVVCHKIDRFSRDRYDYAYYKRTLQKGKIKLEFVEQKLDGSPESIILESVLVGMAEYYSRNLAKEVIKGMNETALQCLHTGGKPPLGYDVVVTNDVAGKKGRVKKKYVINETEAQIVRYIFKRYTEEATYGQIINELNEKGYRTKTGSVFGKNSIHDLLKNKKYVGIYTFGRVSGGRSNPRNSHADNEHMIEIPGGIPAIIDQDTWDKAQGRINSRSHVKGRLHAKDTYLLSGLVRCGDCGSTMVGNRFMGSHRSLGKKMYSYYKCNRSLRTNITCSTKKIKKEWLEELVIHYVKSKIFSKKSIRSIVNHVNKKTLELSTKYVEEIKILENEKNAVKRKIDNLLTLAEDGQIDELLRKRLAQNKQRIEEINFRLSQIKIDTSKIMLTEQQVWDIMQSWKNANEPHELRAMLNTFVKQITVTADNVEIELKLEVASHSYEGDDLSASISRDQMRKMFLIKHKK